MSLRADLPEKYPFKSYCLGESQKKLLNILETIISKPLALRSGQVRRVNFGS